MQHKTCTVDDYVANPDKANKSEHVPQTPKSKTHRTKRAFMCKKVYHNLPFDIIALHVRQLNIVERHINLHMIASQIYFGHFHENKKILETAAECNEKIGQKSTCNIEMHQVIYDGRRHEDFRVAPDTLMQNEHTECVLAGRFIDAYKFMAICRMEGPVVKKAWHAEINIVDYYKQIKSLLHIRKYTSEANSRLSHQA